MVFHGSLLAGRHRENSTPHSMMAVCSGIHHTNKLPVVDLLEGRNDEGDQTDQSGIYRCSDDSVTLADERLEMIGPDSDRRESDRMSLSTWKVEGNAKLVSY